MVKVDKEKFKQIVGLLKEMNKYLVKEDNKFHFNPKMIYCDSCKSIRCGGGDYYNFTRGVDYDGERVYSLEKNAEECLNCKTTKNFREITPYYNLAVLKDRNPSEIVSYIEKGLEEMTSPSLYNEHLPQVVKDWKKLSKKEKKRANLHFNEIQ